MPTGYTADICKKEVSFSEFAMLCARAFGACIDMKEEPFDKEIPEAFEPSDYHLKAIEKAEARLVELQSMDDAAAEEEAEKQYKDTLAKHEDGLAKTLATKGRLKDMIAETEVWTPPTDDHKGMKEFMLQQLRDTLKWDGNPDYYEKAIRNLARSSGTEWKENAIERAKHDIEYHTKCQKEEIERVAQRNAWLSALRDSLKGSE